MGHDWQADGRYLTEYCFACGLTAILDHDERHVRRAYTVDFRTWTVGIEPKCTPASRSHTWYFGSGVTLERCPLCGYYALLDHDGCHVHRAYTLDRHSWILSEPSCI